ncbi:MAG: site-specific DNA-methyltransferase, partial [Chloroflexota bacterium]|nr:site-specific DNA-methyltransferase [Chloroflexota bacterium]
MEDRSTQNRKKLQDLLRDLFQFDHADLDFGIYRIMNEKRDEIERFIEHDLLDVVEEALAQFQEADQGELQMQLAEKRRQLGDDAFDENGAVREQFRNLPIAREYQDLRQQLRQMEVAEETEARVFNDLWRFFSRYYDQGDFLTERRYSSRGAKYCVPYNGEEVLLHWANRDQYYVKTSERFTDYRFKVGGYEVWFKLEQAEVPQDNVKGDTRYFVLHEEQPLTYNDDTRTLTIPFAYRPLTEEEEAHHLSIYNAQQSRSNRRKTLDRSVLCEALETEILDALDDAGLKTALGDSGASSGSSGRSPLGRHLDRYTARNTMDYFVHKDLGGFLRRELDVFLKTEVMHLDDIVSDEAGELAQ